jgi:hypothetical protein
VKRYAIVLIMLLVAAAYAQRGAAPGAPALPGAGGPPQGPPAGGRGQTPEQQAAAAAQNQLEQTPPIPFDAVSLPLMPEGHTMGAAVIRDRRVGRRRPNCLNSTRTGSTSRSGDRTPTVSPSRTP